MDQEGNFIDSRLSKQRDLAAAKAFFEQPRDVAESPRRVVTDGLRSYPRAIAEVLGSEVEHEPVSGTANRIKQDHRGIKQRYHPTLDFHNFDAAQRLCRLVDEIRHFFQHLVPAQEPFVYL